MIELNLVLECSCVPWKKRSNFSVRDRSVFEITQSDLSSCDLLSIYTYARSIDNDEDKEGRGRKGEMDEYENDERRKLSVGLAWSAGEGCFDRTALRSVITVFAPEFGEWFYESRITVFFDASINFSHY